jgi:hypothetical protein
LLGTLHHQNSFNEVMDPAPCGSNRSVIYHVVIEMTVRSAEGRRSRRPRLRRRTGRRPPGRV